MDGRQGWRVVGGAFLVLSITAGVNFFDMPAVLASIIEDTGWTLKQISLGITVWGLAAAVFSPFCGMLIDRFGAQPIMIFGVLLGMLTTYLTSRCTTLTQLYAVLCVAPIGAMCCTFIPVAAVVTRWFIAHRGIAIGLAMLGVGVGGGGFPLLASALLDSHTWRETYAIMALILGLALIPAFLWIRDPDAEEEAAHAAEIGADIDPAHDLTLADAVRSRSFWGLSLGDMLTGVVFAIFNIHLIYYLTADLGSNDTATQVFSVLQLCLGLGTLIFGPLADKFSLRRVLVICYLLPALATILLLPGNMTAVAFVFALIAGLAGGGRIALFPVSLVYCFGEAHMAAIYGLSNTFFMIGNALGPAIGAMIYGNTENARLVYAFCVGTLAISALLVSLIRNERNARTEPS